MGKSQGEIADKALISRKIIAAYESGLRVPVDPAFIFVCKALFPTPESFCDFVLENFRSDSWENFEEDLMEFVIETLEEYIDARRSDLPQE